MSFPLLIAPPFMFLPSLGVGELAILFVIVLILFGPGKLPEVCRSLGDGIKQFKNATKETLHTELTDSGTEKPKPPLLPASTASAADEKPQ